MTTGIIIGRFQVPELTLGHKTLLLRAYEHYDQVGVLLGCAAKQDKDNPLPPNMRTQLFHEWELAFIWELWDQPGNNQAWAANVDKMVKQLQDFLSLGDVTLIGGRQSFVPTYREAGGTLPCREFNVWRGLSGTQVRQQVARNPGNSADVRRGVIWQVMNDAR